MRIWWTNTGWAVILTVTFLVFGLTGMLIRMAFPKKDRGKERAESIELARLIASAPQRLKAIKVHPPPGMVVITLLADSDSMDESQLAFPRKHPDFEALAQLERPATLQFVFQDQPLRRIEKQDAVAYLRLKIRDEE